MATIFDDIKQIENDYPDYYVFYHSYSISAVIYEVYSMIATILYELPSDYPPLPRLIREPFIKYPTFDILMKNFKNNDHDTEFRKCAISVNNSLDNRGEAPPKKFFDYGYSCTDCDFRSIIRNFFIRCNATEPAVEIMTAGVIKLSRKYGYTDNHYKQKLHKYDTKTILNPGSNVGHLLQIFIHKDYVNDVTYPCKPYGIPIPNLKNTDKNAKTHQSRIFMCPDLFFDPVKAVIKHYSSKVSLSDNNIYPGSRGAFRIELKKVLKPLLGNQKNIKRTYNTLK